MGRSSAAPGAKCCRSVMCRRDRRRYSCESSVKDGPGPVFTRFSHGEHPRTTASCARIRCTGHGRRTSRRHACHRCRSRTVRFLTLALSLAAATVACGTSRKRLAERVAECWRSCPVRRRGLPPAPTAVRRADRSGRSVAGVRGLPPRPRRERRRSRARQERRPAMGRRDQAVHDRAGPRRLPADPRGTRRPEATGRNRPTFTFESELANAACMRTHGFPTWPDPISTTDAGSMPEGFDKADPAVRAALIACESVLVETTASPSPGL